MDPRRFPSPGDPQHFFISPSGGSAQGGSFGVHRGGLSLLQEGGQRCWALLGRVGTRALGFSWEFPGFRILPDLFSDFVLRKCKFQGFLDGECIDADFGVDLFADTVMQKMVDLYSLEGSQEEIDILNQLCLTLVLNSASWRPFGEYLAVSSHESQWRPVSLLFLQVYSLRKTTHS